MRAASEVLDELPDLLEGHEEDNGERPLPRHRRDEPLVEGHRPLRPHRLQGAVHRAGVRRRRPLLHLHVHHPRLHHVHWVGRRRGHQPCREARRHVRPEPVRARAAPRQDSLLGLVVGRQLRRRHDHSAVHRQRRAAPQARHAVLPGHPADGVEDALVVPALRRGEPTVSLHPDHSQVGRITDRGTDPTGDEAGRDLAVNRERVAVAGGRPLLLQHVIAALRRLRAISGHLRPGEDEEDRATNGYLAANPTAGEYVLTQGFSVVLPEKLQTGKWNVYRSAKFPLKILSRFLEHPDIGTLHDNFEHAVESFRDYKYIGTRVRVDGTVGEYKWMTYGEAGTSRTAIGSGLVCHGIPKGACIGLYFINRTEWMIVDHACSSYSYISVPLYDTLGPDAVKFIINHATVQVVFCVPQTLSILLGFISQIPSLRLIVVVGGIEENISSISSTNGLEIITYSKLYTQGCDNLQPFSPPKPEDIATMCYTSGTTGTPKGALLSHGNLIASVAGASLNVKFYPTDIYISYLPLAHIYERANQVALAYSGSAVGFYQGDNMKLMDDVAALRPTIFASVPRLYNRIYDGIMNAVKASGGLKEKLFTVAYNAKLHAIANGKSPSPIWDRLVFNKIKDKLGGRVRFMSSGASPLSADVMDFLRVCFGCLVIEGYGMTETSCVITSMDSDDKLTGHVGSPNPACEIKLVDVPEMNYTSEDKPYPRGEICVRGPAIFKGYFKDDIQTKEVIDEDGWLHTGDIGLWFHEGRLKIIDRKKNIFKLAQGEYIAPEKIENVYAKSKFVAQCFVYGDSFNYCLVAIVSVDHDVFKAWAASEGIKFEDVGQLCADQRVRAAVLADMNAVGKQAQLRGFEFVKAITLVPEPFTLENGLLTPTFKVKRPQAKAYFAKAIAEMYAEVSSSQSPQQKLL